MSEWHFYNMIGMIADIFYRRFVCRYGSALIFLSALLICIISLWGIWQTGTPERLHSDCFITVQLTGEVDSAEKQERFENTPETSEVFCGRNTFRRQKRELSVACPQLFFQAGYAYLPVIDPARSCVPDQIFLSCNDRHCVFVRAGPGDGFLRADSVSCMIYYKNF